MKPNIRKRQDIDSFINEESQNNPPPVVSSNSSVSANKPSAFAKPTFGANKKASENKTEAEKNLQSFVSPAKPPSRQTFNVVENSEAKQPGIEEDLRKLNVTPVTQKKGPSVFIKPNLPKMKKF